MDKATRYSLRKLKEEIGQLYPVLYAKDGDVIDGNQRLRGDSEWKKETLEHIDTPLKKALAEIAANQARREVLADEKKRTFSNLAEELMKIGVQKGEIVNEIHKLTGWSNSWIQMVLPTKYKMMERARPRVIPEEFAPECGAKSKEEGNPVETTGVRYCPNVPDEVKNYCELAQLGAMVYHKVKDEENCEECPHKETCEKLKKPLDDFVESD